MVASVKEEFLLIYPELDDDDNGFQELVLYRLISILPICDKVVASVLYKTIIYEHILSFCNLTYITIDCIKITCAINMLNFNPIQQFNHDSFMYNSVRPS